MFYPNTKKRISVSKGGVKEKPPVKTKYDKFKNSVVKLCDKALGSGMTNEQKTKIASLRAKIIIS